MTPLLSACGLLGLGLAIVVVDPIAKPFVQAKESSRREAIHAWIHSCRDLSYDKSESLPITGYRLDGMQPIWLLSARGYDTVFDFYASFYGRQYKAASVVEAIQIKILTQKLPIIFEFKSSNGKWKRSSYDSTTNKLITQDVDRPIASHAISFDQVRTGYEGDFGIYGVTMTVRDVATNMVVAENTGVAKGEDRYYDSENQNKVFAGIERCAYPIEANYVGAWLASLAKERDPLRNVPYEGYDDKTYIKSEQVRWANACAMPVPENKFYGAYPNAKGQISSIDMKAKTIEIGPANKYGLMVHVPSGIAYAKYGGKLGLDEIPIGYSVEVWYENCRRISGKTPEAAFVIVQGSDSEIRYQKSKQKRGTIDISN
jgi:hypothetical protein